MTAKPANENEGEKLLMNTEKQLVTSEHKEKMAKERKIGKRCNPAPAQRKICWVLSESSEGRAPQAYMANWEPNGLCSPAGIRRLKLHGLGIHPTHPLHQLKPKMSKRVKIADRKPGEWSCFPTFGLLNDLHEDSKVYAVET